MPDGIGPYDVMRYERRVTYFLSGYIEDMVLSDHPLMNDLRQTRKMIEYYFRNGQFEYTPHVRTISIFGRTIEGVDQIPLVSPDGQYITESLEDVYAERLSKEQNPWETIYELAVASDCESAGLDTKLVHEGSASGPDVYVWIDDIRIDIECKRRRPLPTREEQDELSSAVTEQVSEKVDVGDDSFFIEMSGDGPITEDAVDILANQAADLIENRLSDATVDVDGTEYRIYLKDYFTETCEIELSKQDIERLSEFLSPALVRGFISPFDTDDMSPGMKLNVPFKITEEGKTISKGAEVFDYNFPAIENDYNKKVVGNTIKRGRSDLSGRSPAVLFVYLPARAARDMQNSHVPTPDGDSISQTERLSQRISGKLKQSSSLNAIVTNTTYFGVEDNRAILQRGYKTYENPSPESELPDQFKEFLDGGLIPDDDVIEYSN